MSEPNNQSREPEDKNLRKIITKYLAHWRLFAIGLTVGLLAVFLYIRYFADTQYEIQGTILVKDESAGQGTIESNTFKNLGLIKTSRTVADEMGILKSPGLMEKVISKLALNINYYVEGSVRDVEIYGKDVPVEVLVDETAAGLIYDQPIYIKLLGKNNYEIRTSYDDTDFQKEFAFGDLVSEPFGTFTITRRPENKFKYNEKPLYFVIRDTDKIIDQFLKNFNVELANDAGSLLNMSFLSVSKKKGEDVMAGLIETYVEEMIKYENELAANTIKMIDDRIKLLSGEITGVEKSVEKFKTENDLTDVGSNASIYVQQANDYQKMITDYQSQINVIESIESYMVQGDLDSPIPGALSTSDPSLIGSIDRYNATLQEKKQLSQSASSGNPLMVTLDKTLTDLSQAILQNVRSAKSRLTIAQRNLQANANKYQAQIAKVPAMERKLLDISREKSTKEGLYLFLLQKREEEVLSMAAPVSSTRIVSLPKAERTPVSPNKVALYLGGLLLGMFLPFSFIYVKDLLNNTITSIDQLSSLTSAPILGEIARNYEDKVIVTTEKYRTPTAELFRLLRFNLEYLKKSETNKTLLVTSTVKDEGKTFIATNLAVSLAGAGEKVVVVSFDLRRPKLLQNLNIPDEPGITDFILDKEMLVNKIILTYTAVSNLFLVGSGKEVLQVGNLMLSARIATLMDVLKSNFDRIIIDSAPIGSVSDAFALNSYIDSTIYVVRQDVTNKDHLQTLSNIYQNGKLKNTMVLFNDTVSKETYGYGDGIEEKKFDFRSEVEKFLNKSRQIAHKVLVVVRPYVKRVYRKILKLIKR